MIVLAPISAVWVLSRVWSNAWVYVLGLVITYFLVWELRRNIHEYGRASRANAFIPSVFIAVVFVELASVKGTFGKYGVPVAFVVIMFQILMFFWRMQSVARRRDELLKQEYGPHFGSMLTKDAKYWLHEWSKTKL